MNLTNESCSPNRVCAYWEQDQYEWGANQYLGGCMGGCSIIRISKTPMVKFIRLFCCNSKRGGKEADSKEGG